MVVCTGIDLSKVLGGQTKILGGQKEVKSDKCMGVSQLLGGHVPGLFPPKSLCLWWCAAQYVLSQYVLTQLTEDNAIHYHIVQKQILSETKMYKHVNKAT